ncbi:asparagine synthase-related protein [Algoriphagus sp. AGSA1]|uniref:asparagine synthase-related protein n=1 Tax=Algoriphagus sp. AGSA1 TaxID=2907213 RepID=UPI001F3D5195|nr:asparagine synthase-related protein [Algoriphagus sp. AGSA1]MCE7053268.1 asparagine synthase-related protein [Algoriphagus sp. AGSA1]
MEGKIYGKAFESIVTELKTLSTEKIDEKLSSYAFDLDGEFYFYKIDITKNQIAVFGDHLNRLPLYFGSKDQRWVISRQIKTAYFFLQPEISRLNLAEFMVFDYNLADRTWFENIFCLQLDDYIQIDALNNNLQVKKKKTTYNFEDKTKIKNTKVLLEDMAEVFTKACTDRAETTNVLSMSGGMDSRSVAAGLVKGKKPLLGVTFENAEKTALYDGIIAKEIADALTINWQKISLTKESFNYDIASLMKVKMSIQPCRFYFLYQFCNEVSKKFGSNIIFFTGDGGDKVFPDLSKNLKFNSDLKLFRLIMKENHEFTINLAAKITGVSEKELEKQIFSYIKELPAATSAGKLEQFTLRARMKRYIFEGEDRNRNYFWSTTPFLSKKFFSLMMHLDPEIKKQKNFYSDFIAHINHDVASIRNENFSKGKLQIGKGLYSFIKKLSNRYLSRKSKEHLKSIFKSSSSPNNSAKQYITEIKRLLPINTLLEEKTISRSLNNYSTGQLSLLLTYLKAYEIMSTNRN